MCINLLLFNTNFYPVFDLAHTYKTGVSKVPKPMPESTIHPAPHLAGIP